MKYTIEGFSQLEAQKLNMDVVDLVILRWFVDFYPNMEKVIIKEKEYAWVVISKLKEDLPIVKLEKRMLIYRFQKLVNCKVLNHIKTYKLKNTRGTFTFYGFGINYERLIKSTDTNEVVQSNAPGSANTCTRVVQSNAPGSATDCTTKINLLNTSITDSSIKYSTESEKRFKKPTIEEIDAYLKKEGYDIYGFDGEEFYNFYESKGWMVGKTHMKSWHGAVGTWVKNRKKQINNSSNKNTSWLDID